MTDCGCEKAMAELEEYLHRELTNQDSDDIAEHLENCDHCSAEHLVGLTLTLKVQQACKEIAPEDLRAAVRARLENA